MGILDKEMVDRTDRSRMLKGTALLSQTQVGFSAGHPFHRMDFFFWAGKRAEVWADQRLGNVRLLSTASAPFYSPTSTLVLLC